MSTLFPSALRTPFILASLLGHAARSRAQAVPAWPPLLSGPGPRGSSPPSPLRPRRATRTSQGDPTMCSDCKSRKGELPHVLRQSPVHLGGFCHSLIVTGPRPQGRDCRCRGEGRPFTQGALSNLSPRAAGPALPGCGQQGEGRQTQRAGLRCPGVRPRRQAQPRPTPPAFRRRFRLSSHASTSVSQVSPGEDKIPSVMP